MKKIIALFLAAAMAVSALTACSSGEEGSPSGSSSSAAESSAPYEFTLDGAYQAVVYAYGEDFLPSMDITEEQLQDMGIDTQYFEEFKAQGPMISTHVDTLIAVKAQPEHAEDVEDELNKYRDSLLEGMNYPMNMPKIQASEVAVYDDYVFFVMLGKYNDTDETDEAALLDYYVEQNDRGLEALHAYFNYQDPVLPESSESSAESPDSSEEPAASESSAESSAAAQ